MKLLLICAGFAAACSSSNDASVDAPRAVDAKPATSDAPAADAHATTGNAMSHTLFVNTEGDAVSPGSDNATTDHTSLAGKAGTLAPWLVGDAARATKIAALMAQFTSTLAPYGVTIVNARPAAGPYDMLVITDDVGTVIGLPATSPSITPVTCNTVASLMTFSFPSVLTTQTDEKTRDFIVNGGIAMFANANGVPLSRTPNDCMCYAAAGCNAVTVACTIGGAGTAVDASSGGFTACGDTDTTMDENAKFIAAFGSH